MERITDRFLRQTSSSHSLHFINQCDCLQFGAASCSWNHHERPSFTSTLVDLSGMTVHSLLGHSSTQWHYEYPDILYVYVISSGMKYLKNCHFRLAAMSLSFHHYVNNHASRKTRQPQSLLQIKECVHGIFCSFTSITLLRKVNGRTPHCHRPSLDQTDP